jgi:hypothetical protein
MDGLHEVLPVFQLSALKSLLQSQISEKLALNGPPPGPLPLRTPLDFTTPTPRGAVQLTMGTTSVFPGKEIVSLILFVSDLA